MKRTNCVNCGGAIDSDTAKCPFCGTSYVDMSPADIQLGGKFVIRIHGLRGPQLMTAYVTDYSVMMDGMSYCRDVNGKVRRNMPHKIIKFGIVAEELN